MSQSPPVPHFQQPAHLLYQHLGDLLECRQPLLPELLDPLPPIGTGPVFICGNAVRVGSTGHLPWRASRRRRRPSPGEWFPAPARVSRTSQRIGRARGHIGRACGGVADEMGTSWPDSGILNLCDVCARECPAGLGADGSWCSPACGCFRRNQLARDQPRDQERPACRLPAGLSFPLR